MHGRGLRNGGTAVPALCLCPPTCHGARYDAKTLEITYRDRTIADVLGMTVDAAFEFFADEPPLHRAPGVVREVGLGYLCFGQAATQLSGGEAQCIKLATELQRMQRGTTLYVLDEPTPGLHAEDVNKLMTQLDGWSRPATPSSWWNTTCASWRQAITSSTSVLAPAKRAAAWWLRERL